ncbi:hypothetical protein [Tolypothrix sp. VBCCA 56010]|uniref:hypothetical protein n=1 Tax=Tolypothrix sp. VBCCA 56010 TaxID=3137731 RepID=UPI003D7F109B
MLHAGELQDRTASPMPNAQCPMPNAQCPMPNYLFPFASTYSAEESSADKA